MQTKIFKIQLILLISYLLLTIFFLIGFHNSMYETFLPYWLGELTMLFAAVYFVGGGLLIPIGWVIFIVYHYQVQETMQKQAYESPLKDFLFKQLFPLMTLGFYLINLVYLAIIHEVTSLDFVHFLACLLLVFALYAQDRIINKTSWTVIFGASCGILTIWLVDLVVRSDFKQAMLEQRDLIYGMSYQVMFYLIWILSIFVVGYAVVGFFYILNRSKYRHLLLLITSLMFIFLNIVRQVDVFSQLRIG
ncbi:MAG: hypothetical protein AB7V00_04115 [Bacilli bacterium]